MPCMLKNKNSSSIELKVIADIEKVLKRESEKIQINCEDKRYT